MATPLKTIPSRRILSGVVAPCRSAEKVVERERPVHRPRGCRTGGSPQIETSFSLIASSPRALHFFFSLFIRFLHRGSVTRSYAEIAHVTGIFLPRICILPRRAGAKDSPFFFREIALFDDFFDHYNDGVQFLSRIELRNSTFVQLYI